MNSSLTNSYLKLPSLFYKEAQATQFTEPKLLLFNKRLAKELGPELENLDEKELALIFSGQKLLENSKPIALAYAGFQFGHPVPSLGDGRALLLGELNGCDIQLKGSGQTIFSRRGDGLSALGPVLREYIISEFMHTMGIPTTRALAAVATDEDVYRQFGPEPGGVFTRVAKSHLRVGTFQYALFKQDFNALRSLLDYAVDRHYPEFNNLDVKEKALSFLESFTLKQGKLIADWTTLGFIHGVMNTDNCSIAGITIDYGPCAFMEEFRFQQVFSSIDENGRYSYFNQVPIIQWNILRLADCLLPLISDDQDLAVKEVEKRIYPHLERFHHFRMEKLASKFGISDFEPDDENTVMLFLNYLQENSLDFTLSFRNLPKLYQEDHSFYPASEKRDQFLTSWKKRVKDVSLLNSINPLYIPRNHLVQKAIDEAYRGDMTFVKKLIEVLEDPFTERHEDEFSTPPQVHQKVLRTFCGT